MQVFNKSTAKKSTKNLIVSTGQQLLFWIISYLFFIMFFGRANRDYQTTILFASMLFPLAIITSYFLNYYLIPRFLFRSEIWKFVLFLIYTLIISFWIELMITMFIFVFVIDLQFYKMDPASFDTVFLLVGLYFIILGFITIEQIKRAFQMKKENTRLEKNQLETELKLKEAELKLLRAQIHPHFLFNTLNNLYGLTLEKSDLAPELVLKLSDLMDYILYECNAPKVGLSSELEHFKNYIEIEKIRYAQKLKIHFNIEGDPNQLEIAPMLLLAFFENAFKHGVSKSIKNPFVLINIQIHENNFHLSIVNTRTPDLKNEEDYTQGIGLKNVQKRLQLIYPDRYRLDIKPETNKFEVDLQISLDKSTHQNPTNQWTN
ncbi:sensor histidine kinase [Sunxiuqinia sp. A32]|uniref:sensor histidine kinase n=1 Tax=Sunxiuqinia sp. A32 TaxID=3461496 RepID=UPI004045EFB8